MNCDKKHDFLPPMEEVINRGEELCPVAWALDLMTKARAEACGRDVMCRDGLNQIVHILSDDVRGRGETDDLELLKDLLGVIAEQAGCDMARYAANCVLKSIELNVEEWEMHIKRKRCTALYCKSYYTVHVSPEKCTGCGKCLSVCPAGAIAGGEGLIHVVDNDKCTRCGACFEACPDEAFIKAGGVKPRVPESPVPVGSFQAGGGLRRRRRGGTDS